MPTLPFRADHVGSLLRPQELKDAFEQHQQGNIDDNALQDIEDRCVRDAVKLQEDIGLQAVTDGEFRRLYFHIDFLKRLRGVAVQGGIATKFHKHEGEVDFAPPRIVVEGKLEHAQGIEWRNFEFLKSVSHALPKVCIPSPTMVHFRGGRKGISETAYPDLDEFFADLVTCFRQEIDGLYQRGCRYIHLDDTNLAYLCDPQQRQASVERGQDPDHLPLLYAKLINDVIEDRPDDLCVCIHLCRGNFRSAWIAEGSYEPVADVLFNNIAIDGYFLEFDDERSGDFSPLRFVPKGKRVVLGLISSKQPQLEPKSEIITRINEASEYIDLDQLCLSPQCGFASTIHGNDITLEDQIAKLKLVVEIAEEVWKE